MTHGASSTFVLDSLESRCFLSAAPLSASLAPAAETALVQPLATRAAALAKIAGSYTGAVVVTGVHSRPINVTLKQTAAGKLAGTLTTPQDSSIRVKVTGKVTSKKAFTLTLSGTHSGGPIQGTGTGTVKGTRLTVKMTFVQGATRTPGTITLTKV